MEKDERIGKSNRTLSIYARLNEGKVINKSEEARRYGVSEKSIQRDFDEIRLFLEERTVNEGIHNELVYDRVEKGYRLQNSDKTAFSNSEILAVSKILLDSRAFTKKEMDTLLGKLVDNCVSEQNKTLVEDLLRNEKYHYIQPKHGRKIMDSLWDIGHAVFEKRIIEFDYQGIQGHSPKHRIVEPQAIMFSEYYFYLVAFIRNIDKEKSFRNPEDLFPTIYRIDRIKNLVCTDEKYKVIYKNRFEEGEFRKRVQFMYGGKLRKIRFKYTGYSIEAVEDRLPTAKVTQNKDGTYDVEAEVFGDGIDMWLRSQGEDVKKG